MLPPGCMSLRLISPNPFFTATAMAKESPTATAAADDALGTLMIGSLLHPVQRDVGNLPKVESDVPTSDQTEQPLGIEGKSRNNSEVSPEQDTINMKSFFVKAPSSP